MSFNEKLNRLSWEKMTYILWFPTEGHFVLLKKQEIFPGTKRFYGLLVDSSEVK